VFAFQRLGGTRQFRVPYPTRRQILLDLLERLFGLLRCGLGTRTDARGQQQHGGRLMRNPR
jgi:hypothetical protein